MGTAAAKRVTSQLFICTFSRITHYFEALQELGLLSYAFLELIEGFHLLGCDGELGLFIVPAGGLGLLLLLSIGLVGALAFLLVLLLLPDLAQGQVVLQPLVLVLVVHEVCQQFPVTRRVLGTLDHEIVAVVAEVGHRLHPHYSVLDVLQFLKPQRIRSDRNLGVSDSQNAFLSRANQFDSRPVSGDSYTLLRLSLLHLIFIIFLNLVEQGGAPVKQHRIGLSVFRGRLLKATEQIRF